MLISKERSQIFKKISYGVPQGSLIGPLLFIPYINDFASVYEKVCYVLFANDTHIFLNGKYINKLVEIIQSELFKLCNCLQMNKLTLNLPKTHFMVFHRAKHKLNNISISLNSDPIEQVNHTKLLGVVIDNKLDWLNHISYINARIAKGMGIICRAKTFFTSSALIILDNTSILPYMIYCVEVWGNALTLSLHKNGATVSITFSNWQRNGATVAESYFLLSGSMTSYQANHNTKHGI